MVFYFFFTPFEIIISKIIKFSPCFTVRFYVFKFLLSFSYSLLIILNKSGLFNIIPSCEDENRAMFFNRTHCFQYLNRLNPSFTMF